MRDSGRFPFVSSRLARSLLLRLVLIPCAVVIPVIVVSRFDAVAALAWFGGPLISPWNLASVLNASGPLMLAAAGAALAVRAGVFNLGGDGQVYSGAFAFSLVAITFPGTGPFGVFFSFLAAAAAGALLGSLSVLLKRWAGAAELITSFLVSQCAVLFLDWAVASPFRDPASSISGMIAVASPFRFSASGGFPLTAAPFAGLAVVAVMILFQKKTGAGLVLRIAGESGDAARYAGKDPERIRGRAFIVSAALQGLSGALLVAGPFGRLSRGAVSGYGWNALAAALISGSEPAALPFVALLFAWLDKGSETAMLLSGIPESLSLVSLGILFAAFAVLRGKRQPWR